MSTCMNCGAEYDLERAPRFCRRCGIAFLPVQPSSDPPPEEEQDAFQELVSCIESALPKNFKGLTRDELKEHLVRAIWEQTSRKAPVPRSDPDMEVVREVERWINRGFGARLMPIRTVNLLRKYHLRKDQGEIHHLSLTPKEAEKLQIRTAAFGCEITPCDCETVR
jgi:hypothetical protein